MKRLWSYSLVLTLVASMCASGCSIARRHTAASSSDTAGNAYTSELSLARLNERHGDVAQATKIYNAVLAKDPGNQLAHHRLGVTAAKRGNYEQALTHFDNASNAGPQSSELLADIGYVHYLAEDFAKADEKLRAAISLDPDNKNAHNNLGLVLGEQGKFDESFAEFRRAGSEAEALSNLAYVQSQTGNLEESETNYHRAIALDNTLRPAVEALLQVASTKQMVEEQMVSNARPAATPQATAAVAKPRVTSEAPQREVVEIVSHNVPVESANHNLVASRVTDRSQTTTQDSSDGAPSVPEEDLVPIVDALVNEVADFSHQQPGTLINQTALEIAPGAHSIPVVNDLNTNNSNADSPVLNAVIEQPNDDSKVTTASGFIDFPTTPHAEIDRGIDVISNSSEEVSTAPVVESFGNAQTPSSFQLSPGDEVASTNSVQGKQQSSATETTDSSQQKNSTPLPDQKSDLLNRMLNR